MNESTAKYLRRTIEDGFPHYSKSAKKRAYRNLKKKWHEMSVQEKMEFRDLNPID